MILERIKLMEGVWKMVWVLEIMFRAETWPVKKVAEKKLVVRMEIKYIYFGGTKRNNIAVRK